MIEIGDKITVVWNPWSSHPQTIKYEIIPKGKYMQMHPIERWNYTHQSSTLIKALEKNGYIRIDNWRIQPQTKANLPEIFHIKLKNIEKMSEVTKPTKTEKDIHDLDYIQRIQKVFTQKVEDPSILNLGMKALIWEVFDTQHGKSIIKQRHPMVINVTDENIDELKQRINRKDGVYNTVRIIPTKTLQLPKSKKEFCRIKKQNKRELKKVIKNVHNKHKNNVVSFGKPGQHNLLRWQVQGKINGSRETLIVKAKTCELAHKEATWLGLKEAMVLMCLDTLSKERKPVKTHRRPLKQANTNPNAHLRMVCIKHTDTREVKRLEWYKANKIVNGDKKWAYCEKWEHKRYVNMQHTALRQMNPHANSIVPGSMFTRAKGLRISKRKGIPGNRLVKSQLIKISTLPKDEIDENGDAWEILTKTKQITVRTPIFRYVTFPQIVKNTRGVRYWPVGTILGQKTVKFIIDWKTETKEIECPIIKKYVYKTIKIYNPPKRKKVERTTQENAL